MAEPNSRSRVSPLGRWKRAFGVFYDLHALIRLVGGGGRLLAISFLFSFTTALFEGATMAFVIPLLDLLFSASDGKTVTKIEFLKYFSIPVPESFQSSRGLLVGFIMGLLFLMTVLKTFSDFTGGLALGRSVQLFIMNVRTRVFGRMLSFGKAYFDHSASGHLYNLVISHGVVVSNGFMEFRSVVSTSLFGVVYLAILISISWKLTLIGMVLYPIYHSVLRIILVKIRRTAGDHVESMGDLSQAAAEVISAIPLIHSYGTEAREQGRFRKIADRVRQLDISITKKQNLVLAFQEVFMTALLVGLAMLAYSILTRENPGSGPQYLVFFLVLRRVSSVVATLTNFRLTLEKMGGSLRAILKLFDDTDKSFVPNGYRVFKGLKQGIEFRNTHFQYQGGRPILKGISFSLAKGKFTAIIGPSGSGKTTVMGLIQRFYDCPPGSIFIDGVDIREYDYHSLRKHCAVVSQDVFLFNTTLRNNLTYGLDHVPEDSEFRMVLQRSSLEDLVNRLPEGLNTVIGDRGVKLSGGEKQRLSIARAMLKRADILLLDEATSALDTETERQIQTAMDKLTQNQTVLVVAHRLSTILHADKVIVLEKGEIVEQGPVNELIARGGRFHHYYSLQNTENHRKAG